MVMPRTKPAVVVLTVLGWSLSMVTPVGAVPNPTVTGTDSRVCTAGRSVARLSVLQLRSPAGCLEGAAHVRRGGILPRGDREPLYDPDGRPAQQRDGRDPRRRPRLQDSHDRPAAVPAAGL